MNLLVTGYKGFIGSNLADILQKRGYSVSLYEWGETLPIIKGLNWVFHIGAISSTIETDVNKIIRQNYDSSVYLYNECVRYGVNFQFSSSASLYGLGGEFSETSPIDPRTPYAWSKYMVEKYIYDNPSDIITHIFRYFNVYGPGEDHKGNQASPYHQFGVQAKLGSIKVFEGSDRYCRDFIHVMDVIDTHIEFLKVMESGVWNVGSGKTISFLDVAKSFDVPIYEVPFPEHLKHSYQKYTCADTTKMCRTKMEYNLNL